MAAARQAPGAPRAARTRPPTSIGERETGFGNAMRSLSEAMDTAHYGEVQAQAADARAALEESVAQDNRNSPRQKVVAQSSAMNWRLAAEFMREGTFVGSCIETWVNSQGGV